MVAFAALLCSCGQTESIPSEDREIIISEKDPAVTADIENAISEAEISAMLEYLSSDELEGRKTGTAGIEKAAVYIENFFRKNGIQPYFETYRDSFETKGVTGYNLVGYIEGSDPALKNEPIIIGAHYDHVGSAKAVAGDTIANGANDNASGTTAVLQLAKYLADKNPKRPILLTLFSAEEMGLVGAKELAMRLEAERLEPYVMFNIEMIGVPMQDKDYLVYLTGYNESNLAEKFNQYSGEEVIGFLPQAQEYRLFQRSDNFPFYSEFNIPAQTVSTFDFTNYDYYHHVDDEFQYMDTAHMENVIENLIPGLLEMANSEEKEIVLE